MWDRADIHLSMKQCKELGHKSFIKRGDYGKWKCEICGKMPYWILEQKIICDEKLKKQPNTNKKVRGEYNIRLKNGEYRIFIPEKLRIKMEKYIYNNNLSWYFVTERALISFYQNHLEQAWKQKYRYDEAWEKKNSKIVNIYIRDDIYEWFSSYAEQNYTYTTTMIINCLENYLANKNKN